MNHGGFPYWLMWLLDNANTIAIAVVVVAAALFTWWMLR